MRRHFFVFIITVIPYYFPSRAAKSDGSSYCRIARGPVDVYLSSAASWASTRVRQYGVGVAAAGSATGGSMTRMLRLDTREYETYALDLTNERFDVPEEAGIPFDTLCPRLWALGFTRIVWWLNAWAASA
jgi:hypothetical protein